jgi:hypothetical protein
MSVAPRYEHHCNECTFLGQYDQYDLYYCSREGTVIARFSNEEDEYASGIELGILGVEYVKGESHPLRECLIRALMIPELRHEINEDVIKSRPEMARDYREVLKLADARIK